MYIPFFMMFNFVYIICIKESDSNYMGTSQEIK